MSGQTIAITRRTLKNETPTEAGTFVAGVILQGTGIDLLLSVYQAVVYSYDKYQKFENRSWVVGEEQALQEISVEVGKDALKSTVKKMASQAIVNAVVTELEEKKIIPPELKNRTEEIVDDLIDLGIDKLEKQFLEE
ncbi:MAG: hypothetical protein V1777_04410 [Candidatus Micrarchaeota archaeon]